MEILNGLQNLSNEDAGILLGVVALGNDSVKQFPTSYSEEGRRGGGWREEGGGRREGGIKLTAS